MEELDNKIKQLCSKYNEYWTFQVAHGLDSQKENKMYDRYNLYCGMAGMGHEQFLTLEEILSKVDYYLAITPKVALANQLQKLQKMKTYSEEEIERTEEKMSEISKILESTNEAL